MMTNTARQAHGHGPPVVETGGRTDRQHTTGDADRDREDVVDEQRPTRRRATATTPQVLAAHDVGAAARRVGHDRLAVRDHHDHQQHADDDRDRHQQIEGGRPDPGLQQQDDQDLVGRIRGRRDRIRREDRTGRSSSTAADAARSSDEIGLPMRIFLRPGISPTERSRCDTASTGVGTRCQDR